MSFNRIILEGRLTKDVEIRYSPAGVSMARSTIAVSKKFTVNGDKKEKTLFVNIQLWKRSAEVFNQYCQKGSHILIEGELENNDYVDNQGNKKFGFVVNVSNLQMLDGKNDNTAPQQQQHQQSSYTAPQNSDANRPEYSAPKRQEYIPPDNSIDEDEIPF